MLSFGALWTGLHYLVRNLLRRDRVGRELTDEIDGCVDLLIEEHVARGMSRDNARRTARLELGGVDHVKEHVVLQCLVIRPTISNCSFRAARGFGA